MIMVATMTSRNAIIPSQRMGVSRDATLGSLGGEEVRGSVVVLLCLLAVKDAETSIST